MPDWNLVASAISDATRRPFKLLNVSSILGGDINEAFHLTASDGTHYFIKLNSANHQPLFQAEISGLESLAASRSIRTPRPITHGIAGQHSFLVLEYLELKSHGDAQALGTQLAALHRHTAKQFGYAQDNFIGTTAQPNGWDNNWLTFWREQRLGFQLQLAKQNGYGGKLQQLGAQLQDALAEFFSDYTPQASLLHGDLWSGNYAYLADGTPLIFDPACYYGDRESDLAMTELFGGFPASFYTAYQTAYPLAPGYKTRRELYQLYHILNHANLFGAGYAKQAEQIMLKLLA